MAHRDKRLHHVFRRFSRDQYCAKHDTPLWDASTASKHREPECIKCAFERIDRLEAASRNERERWMPLYAAVNELLAYMGAYGAADGRGDRAQAVMDALAALDGGYPQPNAEKP
jgi:hypothetical protein